MEEKLRILKMVEEGTISAEQARELLEALGEPETVQARLERPRGSFGRTL